MLVPAVCTKNTGSGGEATTVQTKEQITSKNTAEDFGQGDLRSSLCNQTFSWEG